MQIRLYNTLRKGISRMFPSWDSLDELERFQDCLGRINFWGPFALAAISLAIALAWGLYNRSVDNRVGYLRGIRDGKVDAELERRITPPELEFATSLDILKKVPGAKVYVISVDEDRSRIVTRKLEPLFMAAGWRASFASEPWKFKSVGDPVPEGITVMLAAASGSGDPTPHDGATALLEMFSANGIEARSGQFSMSEYPEYANGIVVLVGRL